VYLAAALAATLAVALPAPRANRVAVGILVAGAAVHALAFLQLHRQDPPPPLTRLPFVVSLSAWMAVLFFLGAARFTRLSALAVRVAPAAFLGAFATSLATPGVASLAARTSPAWSHAHVLLASGGLALLGVAGGAGLLYVAHHRRIKAKRGLGGLPLPPLEALDRVNVVALCVGFLLLTLGVLTGVMWVRATQGGFWTSDPHASATLVAWAIYAVLLGARFGAGQGARRSALSAVAGFAVLLFAVVGVGLLK
jgi:ABC-type transport system involved in cytochrome c biogenesis permease subunit